MPDLIQFIAESRIEAAAGESKPTKISIVAYSGGIMNVVGFGPTIVDLAGLKLPASVPLLADHENRLNAVAGGGKPEVKSNRLHVNGALADTAPAATQVKALMSAGVELQASVGVEPIVRKWLQAGEKVQVNGRTLTVPPAGGGC